MGLGETDVATLNYLDYFTQQIPIDSAYFLHVLPKYDLLTALYEKEAQALISGYTIDDHMRKQMKDTVNSALTKKDEIQIEYDICEGDPLEEMISLNEKNQADLIVIGQKKGLSPHGIFAKNLARFTKVDALVIPAGAKPGISTILVPIDFSDGSVKALEAAIALHKRLKVPAQILCLHVYNMPNTNYFRNEEPWIKMKSTVENNLKDSFDAFLDTVAGEDKTRIEIALVERQTTGISNFIIDFAINKNVDFMVMGARGHSKVHLLLMESVTEGVLDLNQNIPTLVVR